MKPMSETEKRFFMELLDHKTESPQIKTVARILLLNGLLRTVVLIGRTE